MKLLHGSSSTFAPLEDGSASLGGTGGWSPAAEDASDAGASVWLVADDFFDFLPFLLPLFLFSDEPVGVGLGSALESPLADMEDAE